MTRYQFSLASLIGLTTIVAVLTAIFAQLGIVGILFSLLAGQMALMGGMCIVAAVCHRRPGWPAGLILGVIFLAIAIFFAYAIYAAKTFDLLGLAKRECGLAVVEQI